MCLFFYVNIGHAVNNDSLLDTCSFNGVSKLHINNEHVCVCMCVMYAIHYKNKWLLMHRAPTHHQPTSISVVYKRSRLGRQNNQHSEICCHSEFVILFTTDQRVARNTNCICCKSGLKQIDFKNGINI